jgi:DNA-binding transcriptional LysR family regulator
MGVAHALLKTIAHGVRSNPKPLPRRSGLLAHWHNPPMSVHFDLVDLRLMVRVAEANSLTKGAEASHISLPAASTRIKNLEESIGAKLFNRHSQGVTLTPPGQAFVHRARLVLGQIEHLRGDLQEYASGIKGHLRVYANTTSLSEFLPEVLRRYLAAHPDVSIDLQEKLSDEIVRAVIDGKTDIGIVAGSVRTENLQTLPYRSDSLVLVVPDGHPVADLPDMPLIDALEFDHVGLHEASALHAFLNRECERLNKPLKVRIQVSSFESACRMIEAKVGVGVLPESAARRHARSMAIRLVPLSDAWALRSMQICVRSLDELPAFARDLIDLLAEDALMAVA